MMFKKDTTKQKRDKLAKLKAAIDKEELKLKAEELKQKAELKKVPKPPEHLKEGVQQVEEFKPMKERKGFGFWGKTKIKFAPSTTFLIHMEFSNGTMKNFILKSSKETFKYKGRMYYLRYEDALYHLTHRMYELRYHEDYATPIDRELQLKPDPTNKAKPKAWYSVTSSNLKPLIRMEYIYALASSIEISRYLKLGLIVGLLGMVIGIFNAIQLYRIAPLG